VTLRLHPSDPAVRALVLRAITASNNPKIRPLVVRCKTCRAELAKAGMTSAGPLFRSRWRVPETTPGGMTRRAQERRLDELARDMQTRGDDTWMSVVEPADHDYHEGVWALLALPPTMPADYPDLLVRCERDGDAVLARLEVLARLRRRERAWEVPVSMPRLDHTAPDSSWLRPDPAVHPPGHETL
jgi:hypothetical protein